MGTTGKDECQWSPWNLCGQNWSGPERKGGLREMEIKEVLNLNNSREKTIMEKGVGFNHSGRVKRFGRGLWKVIQIVKRLWEKGSRNCFKGGRFL